MVKQVEVSWTGRLGFILHPTIQSGYIETLGGGSYVLRNIGTGFKQNLKQNEYDALMLAAGNPAPEAPKVEEPKEEPKDTKVSKEERKEQLIMFSKKALKEIASGLYDNVSDKAKNEELIQLILDAEYEEE